MDKDDQISLPPVSKNPRAEKKYAGFMTRFAALVFDWQLLILIAICINYGFPSFTKIHLKELGISLSIIYIAYRTLLTKIYGKTIGKYILGIKVVGVNREELTQLQVIVRELISFFISTTFLLGEFLYFFTRRKQALQDIIASSIVIQEKSLTVFKKIVVFIIICIMAIIFVLFSLFIEFKRYSQERRKSDLIESITQKTQIMISIKQSCKTLPSFQNQQISCVLDNKNGCLLTNMSIEELLKFNNQMKRAITDCLIYQDQTEDKKQNHKQ